MTLGLKFFLSVNEKFFDYKNSSFRYYGFSVTINVFWRDSDPLYHKGWVQAETKVLTLQFSVNLINFRTL